jgi:alpha-L-fucosidase 2
MHELQLLPALPKAWPTGSVHGLRARGGFEVDLTWANHTLTCATLRSINGNHCRLRYANQTIDLQTQPNHQYTLGSDLSPLP